MDGNTHGTVYWEDGWVGYLPVVERERETYPFSLSHDPQQVVSGQFPQVLQRPAGVRQQLREQLGVARHVPQAHWQPREEESVS